MSCPTPTVHPAQSECPFESLGRSVACHSRDWASSPKDAWIWGIVVGWDDDDDDDDVLAGMVNRFRWTPEAAARLRRLHAAFEAAHTLAHDAGQLRRELRDARLIAMSSTNRASAEDLADAWGISLEGADDAGGLHEKAAEAMRRSVGTSTDGGPF